MAGGDEDCVACQLLAACRDHIKSLDGARRILASYQGDPGRQGQKLIKHRAAWAWECMRCGWHSDATLEREQPLRCRGCKGSQLKRVESTLYFISSVSRGTRNVFLDPYQVVHFAQSFYRWAALVIGDQQAERLVDLWVWECPEEDIAEQLHRSRSWVHRRIHMLWKGYMEPEGSFPRR